jgi:L-alanine-DL-glutamate epimerase-like enolase superfamily enzyme
MDPDMTAFIVELCTDEQQGFGECIPTSIIYPEGHMGRSSLDEWAVLKEACSDLIGKDCRILSRWIPDQLKIHDANSLVDAIDFALHDLVGKIFNIPVSVLLGGNRPQSVWDLFLIKNKAPLEMAIEACEIQKRNGTMIFKLKPHGRLEEDSETLSLIREKCHSETQVYIDPNYALEKQAPDDVVEYLNKLHPLGLIVCEDPISADFRL